MKKIACLLALLSAAACSPQRFFYYPNRILYADPDRMGLAHELVSYPSANGKTLYGLFFPAKGPAKGTVIHFHGNFGNFSNHFPLVVFLPERGFNLLAFDYQGYGASQGSPSPKRTIEDGLASIRFVQSRSSGTPVFLLGQSLGGAIATVVAARAPEVRAVILEAPFTSYRAMGRTVMSRRVWTWPLVALAPFLSRRYDPIDAVAAIAPRPLLIIHGEKDAIVPVSMSKKMFAAAREPKTLWTVPEAGHLEMRRRVREEYEKRVTRFFEQATK
jgi:uncharacterized protein